MSDEILMSIEKKLDAVVKMMAFKFIEGKSKTELIENLGNLGFDRNLISKITGVKPNVVSVRLSEAKKKKPMTKKSKGGNRHE